MKICVPTWQKMNEEWVMRAGAMHWKMHPTAMLIVKWHIFDGARLWSFMQRAYSKLTNTVQCVYNKFFTEPKNTESNIYQLKTKSSETSISLTKALSPPPPTASSSVVAAQLFMHLKYLNDTYFNFFRQMQA